MPSHKVTAELRAICEEIVEQSWTEPQWATHESDDWFVTSNYEGGFDAAEMAFCFSYVSADSTEWWFQFSLHDAPAIASGGIGQIPCRRAQ